MAQLAALRVLQFGTMGLPEGSEQQQAKALKLKCHLVSLGVPDTDRTLDFADDLLEKGAAARRARLWGAATNAAGLDKTFCLLADSLAELDLSSSLLRQSPLVDVVDATVSAREASTKAHAAMLGYHRQQQLALHQRQQMQQQQQAATLQRSGSGGPAAPRPGFTTALDAAGGSGAGGPGRPASVPLGAQRPGVRPGAGQEGQQPVAGPGPGSAPALADGGSRWAAGNAPSNVLKPGGNWNQPPGAAGGLGRWQAGKRAAPDGGPGDDDDAGPGGGGAGAGAPPAGGGFRTAKTVLQVECKQKGQPPPFAAQAPRAGLTRPVKKQQTGAGGGGSSARGFVPPFVGKALDGANAANGGGGGEGDMESPYPPRLMEMLSERDLISVSPEGGLAVPPELSKLEPKIVEHVFNEVLDASSNITWDDIAGQEAAKRLVQEMVVWPMLNPQLFRGARAPPKGLLLFGPPGTGKTLIGKAVASNISATFFAISASSLTSKWIGEGEKMVRALFTLAQLLQPSIIFIDEVDSLLSARKAEGEHEASRRMKTEFLVAMEGCDPKATDKRVLLIGATNRPEELDDAARRRMPKQLYIPLPCAAARLQMLTNVFKQGCEVSTALTPSDLAKIVERTAGYSGSDMRNLIQEACQGPVRDHFRTRGLVQNVDPSELRPVTLRDFQMASKAQKPSVSESEIERYQKYDESFGAKYVEESEQAEQGLGGEDEW
ncbi:hypothetical protein HYH03_008103 [Edaphochlamys debaryana]|uniref:AAA+ ATPase domain-containing protein n=1 Tax=Edaphochlamys debaryana TaxID=47281 RepID=A0A836BZN5_9CHLO|nr:hypothetical protein HYH03_008103 [Edaphochlamys debaryana]|eukprot:KAG2493584.1 hypothetical protein HYH03_008103 [Edaphochlamys debaryana]